MSHLLEFGMTGPLDESISCFLKTVDPWVHALTFRGLHALTFRGQYVLPLRGLHALTFRGLHVLAFSGLHVLAFKGLYAFAIRGLHGLTFRGLHVVATYPFAGERGEAHGCAFQRRKMHGVATNVYLWKMSEKPKETGQKEYSKFGSCIYV